jgi:thiosulfate dehydrogenase (quinone) large subunit
MLATLRRFVVPLAIVAAAIVVYVEAPYAALGLTGLAPDETVETFLAGIFWILAVLVVIGLLVDQRAQPRTEVEGSAFVRYLFHNPKAAALWLPVRLFVGFAWLGAGLHKAQGTGWLDGGAALGGFWKGAVAIPETGSPKIAFDWYRDFLNILMTNHAEKWFSWLIVFGEIAVGIGLIIGALVGTAALFGAVMNMSFMLAGSASTNPVLFFLAIGLLLGRRVAGYYGVDRYLVRLLHSRPFSGINAQRPTGQVGKPIAA